MATPVRTRTSLFALLLLACTGQRPKAQPAPAGSIAWQRSRPNDDSLLAALGLAQLQHTVLRPGEAEIRLSSGGGISLEDDLIRLVRRGDRVTGQVIRYWRYRGLYPMGPEDTLWSQGELAAYTMPWQCTSFVKAHGFYACTLQFKSPVDWRQLWDSAATFNPWTLPDKPQTVSGHSVNGNALVVVCDDCGSTTVELRAGARFRRLEFGARNGDSKVLGFLHAIRSGIPWNNIAVRPSRSRRYHGKLEGAGGDFCFTPSGSNERWENHDFPGFARSDTLPHVAKAVELWGVPLPKNALPRYVAGTSRWLLIDSIVSMRDTVLAPDWCKTTRP